MKVSQLLENKVDRNDPEMDEYYDKSTSDGPYYVGWSAQSYEWYGDGDPSSQGRYKPKGDGGQIVAINVPTYEQAQKIADDVERKYNQGTLDPALEAKHGEAHYLLEWHGTFIKPMSKISDWERGSIKYDKPKDFSK